MNKKFKYFLLSTVLLVLFSACGITEERDQTKDSLQILEKQLPKQKKNYETLRNLITKRHDAYTKEISTEKKQAFPYDKKTGTLYENVTERKKLSKKMKQIHTDIQKQRKLLQKIKKKKSADVPNDQVKELTQSLEIVENNYASLELYLATGQEQEDELYQNLKEATVNDDTIIGRTYGSAAMVCEESEANIDYTLNLIHDLQKTLKESTHKG